jgi:hypothetical protein
MVPAIMMIYATNPCSALSGYSPPASLSDSRCDLRTPRLLFTSQWGQCRRLRLQRRHTAECHLPTVLHLHGRKRWSNCCRVRKPADCCTDTRPYTSSDPSSQEIVALHTLESSVTGANQATDTQADEGHHHTQGIPRGKHPPCWWFLRLAAPAPARRHVD